MAVSIKIAGNALSLKLPSFRSDSKWPEMINNGGARTNHDNSCNAYHAMAPPLLRNQYSIYPCSSLVIVDVFCCMLSNDARMLCSAPLDWHIAIELSSRNISGYRLYMASKCALTMWVGYCSRGLENCCSGCTTTVYPRSIAVSYPTA